MLYVHERNYLVWHACCGLWYFNTIPFLENHGWHQIHIRAKTIINDANSFYKGTIIGGVLHRQTDRLFEGTTIKAE